MNQLDHVAQRGEGFFCTVTQYKDPTSLVDYAVKQLKKEHYANTEYRHRFEREIAILKELQGCRNVIEYIDEGEESAEQKLWYIMPYAAQNLYKFIKRNNTSLDAKERFYIADQVIEAIRYAHEKGVLHRDISPQNVLVFENERNIIKVADFGLGKNIESLSHLTRPSAAGYGQAYYVAPEQKESLSNATIASDIFSLGKLLYFIFTAKDPVDIKRSLLSSLVSKSCEENSSDRFENIYEFKEHYDRIKNLALETKIADKYLTLSDILNENDNSDWKTKHEHLIKANHVSKIWSDYVMPATKLLNKRSNLKDYYKAVDKGIETFVSVYNSRLEESMSSERWDYEEANIIIDLLEKLIVIVEDNEVRFICIKRLWILAFEYDRWNAISKLKEVFIEKYISKPIETALAETIINTRLEISIDSLQFELIPKSLRNAILKNNETIASGKASKGIDVGLDY